MELILRVFKINTKIRIHNSQIFTEITPQERVRLRERARPVTEQYTRELGEPLVKEILAEIDKVRAKL